MLSLDHYRARRAQFLDLLQGPVLLMAGAEVGRNYVHNPYPFRADSNFLFFFSAPEPGSAALFDPQKGSVTLFLHERTAEGALWHGSVPDFHALQQLHGVDDVLGVESINRHLRALIPAGGLSSMAVADPRQTALACSLTQEALLFHDSARIAKPWLIQAMGKLRACKQAEELDAMRRTAEVTAEAHTAAMAHSSPGVSEQKLNGIVTGIFAQHGCVPAYNNILSVRGEVLHNHSHAGVLEAGDLVLLDAGAEEASGYCSDVTRCWPADGKFDARAAEIYDLVLRSEEKAISMVRPGVRYRDLHLASALVIAEGLRDIGLLRGEVQGLVENAAHALFFPHGVGHLIGIDVHDMEAFGDQIAYPEGRTRSPQFGLGYLRLDMDLRDGMTFTVEPGIYFVPALLRDSERRQAFGDQVDWELAETYLKLHGGRGFGGIRIEDDVLCTPAGPEVLTARIPKQRADIEALVGSA